MNRRVMPRYFVLPKKNNEQNGGIILKGYITQIIDAYKGSPFVASIQIYAIWEVNAFLLLRPLYPLNRNFSTNITTYLYQTPHQARKG